MSVAPPTRAFALDSLDDVDAPKGSPPWARAMRNQMQRQWRGSTVELQIFQKALRLFEEHKGYQQLDDAFGHPFPSLRAFCLAKPPHGLGYDADLLGALQDETRQMTLGEKLAEVQALRATPGNPTGHNQHTAPEEYLLNKDSSKQQYGTSSVHLLAKLKRDAPEVLAGLEHGQYPSVHAAAKAAGIPVNNRLIYLAVNPDKAAAALCARFDPVYVQALVDALTLALAAQAGGES